MGSPLFSPIHKHKLRVRPPQLATCPPSVQLCGDGPSGGALPAAGDAEEARDALGPHLVLPLAGALELDHPVLRRAQAEVAPVLAVLQQVPPGPRRDVAAHVDHHTCTAASGADRQ